MMRDHLAGSSVRGSRRRGPIALVFAVASLAAASAAALDIERDPIRSIEATPRNPVGTLQERLEKGTAQLDYVPGRGDLRTEMLNRMARASPETRKALHYPREMSQAPGQPADEPSEGAQSRIRGVGDAVVEYMIFGGEARLTDRMQGTSTFAADFAARGPRIRRGGRSAISTWRLACSATPAAT